MEQINLENVDWNKLTFEEFQSLEKKVSDQNFLNKKKIPKKKTNNIIVKLRGNSYSIKESLFDRLNKLKSEKSKEKLIDEIIASHNKIEQF